MDSLKIRPAGKDDKKWVASLLKEWWAGPEIVTRGKTHHADTLAGFIAVYKGKKAGLITYCTDGKDCEIVTMNSLAEGKGIGIALVEAVKTIAAAKGCKKLRLITTNDNTKALRFWQKRSFHIAAVRVNAIEEYRKLKPEIPLTGNDGILIRDEIELEMDI